MWDAKQPIEDPPVGKSEDNEGKLATLRQQQSCANALSEREPKTGGKTGDDASLDRQHSEQQSGDVWPVGGDKLQKKRDLGK